MRTSLVAGVLCALRVALVDAAAAAATAAKTTSVPATPHDSYSSSVGVLGCKVNTNRIAYWPDAVDCNNVCVSLSYGGRSVHLLRVDQSGGAHDISYDAWNYLVTGQSATADPTAGGAVTMTAANVDAAQCADLLLTDGHVLPLSAANSMNFLSSCLALQAAGKPSWVAAHYALYNILDPICTYGVDEPCRLADWPAQNQATCPHTLGAAVALTSQPVYNIRYPTGEKVLAGAPAAAATTTAAPAHSGSQPAWSAGQVWAAGAVVVLHGLARLF